jgi:hypothetical protein
VSYESGKLSGICNGKGKLDKIIRGGEVFCADLEDVAVVRLPLRVDRFKAGREPPMQTGVLGTVFLVCCHGNKCTRKGKT